MKTHQIESSKHFGPETAHCSFDCFFIKNDKKNKYLDYFTQSFSPSQIDLKAFLVFL